MTHRVTRDRMIGSQSWNGEARNEKRRIEMEQRGK